MFPGGGGKVAFGKGRSTRLNVVSSDRGTFRRKAIYIQQGAPPEWIGRVPDRVDCKSFLTGLAPDCGGARPERDEPLPDQTGPLPESIGTGPESSSLFPERSDPAPEWSGTA
jgi:hypothetical protein